MPWFVFGFPFLALPFFILGTMTLPFSKGLRFFLFLLLFGGFLYFMPLGPVYNIGFHISYELMLAISGLTAISIIFASAHFFRVLVTLPIALLSIFIFPLRKMAKFLFSSKKLSFAILLLSIISGSWAFHEAARIPRVNHVDIAIKDLPPELENYTIAHITDTHFGVLFRTEWLKKVVAKVNAQNADMIVHTGDIGDALPSEVLEQLAFLQDLKAPDGVFYAFGNHENYQSLVEWREYYRANDMKYLEDDYVILDSVPLILSGAAAGRRASPTDFEKIFKDAPDLVRVHLDHFPARAHEAAAYVDLQLSGHTHGGVTFYLAPMIAMANRGFVNGLYKVNDKEANSMWLYLGAGTGLWSYTPLRLFVPSEIAVLRLVKE